MKSNDHFLTRLQSIVDRFSDRPAVVEDGETMLTYSQLWNAAGNVAVRLHSKGVAPNSVVAISLEKSATWIVAMLGVWRCGAAWVPIDRTLPQDRIDFLLTDSQATWTIDNQSLISTTQPVDETSLPMLSYSPEDLAYLIYTSGTTGKPKGVEVSHRFLVPMLEQQIKAIGLNEFSRSLFLLSTSFDAAISDIGTALLSGAALYLESSLEQESRLTATPDKLLEVLGKREISYVDCPPSLLAKLDPNHCPDTLKSILIGGEVCPPNVIRRWASTVRLINVYGPTECTICSSFSICSPATWDRPLIGQPLAGVQYRIEKETEELLIGGNCLAIGYRNMQGLTKEKFIYVDDRRFYRTGDRVRHDSDGEYVFLGRIDRQIKIRGHRIEPTEIESVLLEQADVLQAAVVLHEFEVRSQLVAFLVVNELADSQRKTHLRAIVSRRLPKYSNPQRWQFLDAMPVTPSGKIDYQRLRRLTLCSEVKSQSKETLTESERLLFDIFSMVLGHQQFEISDSFVAAGGDSLNAMEVVVRAGAVGWPITPSVLLGIAGSVTAIAANRDQSTCIKGDIWHTDYLQTDVLELINQSNFLFGTDPPASSGIWKRPTRLLLTGASGFLGTRLLERLLQNDKHLEVVCLVRGENHTHAKERLFTILAQQNIALSTQQATRISVCVGNIEHAKFGMTGRQYDRLADTVDHIVHSAAHVNSVLSYEQLREVNVQGTLNVAIFADSGVPKRIDAISTLSVFVGSDRCCGVHKESDLLDNANWLAGGYAASKWAAEFLLRQVSSEWTGNRVRYFRPGLLTADTTTNIFPDQDLLTLTVCSLTELGFVPKTDPRYQVDITPVDVAATAMTKLILADTKAHTFHFAHPAGLPANALFDGIRRRDRTIKSLKPKRFKQLLKQRQLDASTTLVALALDRALRADDAVTPDAIDLFQATETQFDMTNTISELAAIHHDWSPPDLDTAFVDKMVATLLNQQEKTS